MRRRWKAGDLCEGQFSEDNQWYKARIDKVLGGGRYLVTYFEYGNSEESEDTYLRPLPGAAPVPQAPVALPRWKAGDLCQGQFSEDNQWYPARIDKVLGGGRYLVTYTEYNNSEESEDTYLRPLPGAAAPVPQTPVALPRWKAGDLCQGQFSEDNQWYPARIDKVLGGGRYLVTYTEYNNSEESEDQFLRPLAGAGAGAATIAMPIAAKAAAIPIHVVVGATAYRIGDSIQAKRASDGRYTFFGYILQWFSTQKQVVQCSHQ